VVIAVSSSLRSGGHTEVPLSQSALIGICSGAPISPPSPELLFFLTRGLSRIIRRNTLLSSLKRGDFGLLVSFMKTPFQGRRERWFEAQGIETGLLLVTAHYWYYLTRFTGVRGADCSPRERLL